MPVERRGEMVGSQLLCCLGLMRWTRSSSSSPMKMASCTLSESWSKMGRPIGVGSHINPLTATYQTSTTSLVHVRIYKEVHLSYVFVYVCMCVYIYICVCMCVYVCVCVCVHARPRCCLLADASCLRVFGGGVLGLAAFLRRAGGLLLCAIESLCLSPCLHASSSAVRNLLMLACLQSRLSVGASQVMEFLPWFVYILICLGVAHAGGHCLNHLGASVSPRGRGTAHGDGQSGVVGFCLLIFLVDALSRSGLPWSASVWIDFLHFLCFSVLS